MSKAYKYRIYPTKKQAHLLQEQLTLCAELYNAALQERRDAYRMCGKNVTYTQQAAQLHEIKALRTEYASIYSQVLQDVLRRVDKAFKAFFQRVKAGLTPGYPRYKSRVRYASLTYPHSGFGIDGQGKLSLAKVGHFKLMQHRPFKGIVKTCSITRSATGKWYASFSCDEVVPDVLPPSENQVGIDVGLKTFAYLSNGEQIENPRFFRTDAKRLAKASHRLSRAEKGTKARAEKRRVVARIHERIRWRRENFVQQQSRNIVNRFGLIAVEALAIRNMIKRPRPRLDGETGRFLPNGASTKTGLNTSIADAAWSAFFRALLYKVEETGRTVIKVPPAYTTQACSNCDHRQEMPLSMRIYTCEQCGVTYNRDHNASLNILLTAIGRDGVALGT